MNILFIVPYVPNKIRVRPYNLIRFLAARGNKVTLLTLTSDELDNQSIKALQDEGVVVHGFPLQRWRTLLNCLVALPTGDPIQSYYCWSPQLAQKLGELVNRPDWQNEYDVVHIEHMRGARFGQYLLKKQAFHLPVVWDSVDCISYLFKQSVSLSKKRATRWVTKFELSRSRRYEGILPALFDRILVTSRIDYDSFMELIPADVDHEKFEILPNGVDLEYFCPAEEIEREPDTLVVSGKMSYHANVSMVLYLVNEIMPLIWFHKPQVKLWVVGKDPPQEIRSLAADPRVVVTGHVPDIRPYLRKAKVAVAPLTYGAGIQNKVLEAMACATPVVVTPRVISALAVQADRELLVGHSPNEFASSVLRLLDDEDYRQKIGFTGRKYVETSHNWNQITEELEEIYRDAKKRKAAFQP
jgi:polysaccharide biosynthesis protein PslH